MRANTFFIIRHAMLELYTFADGVHDTGAPGTSFCHTFWTISQLLDIIDVLPQLELPTDTTLKRELQLQCSHISHLTHTYYDAVQSIDKLDTFTDSRIYCDDNMFTEDQCPDAWQKRRQNSE